MLVAATPASVPTVIITTMPIIAATVVVTIGMPVVTAIIIRTTEPKIDDWRADNH
jgi:hypothetical protein